jgi:SAM-dependent methyltransferase
MHETRIVRDGYDQVAAAYLETRRRHSPDLALIEQLTSRLPANASILDAGCGAGFPIAAELAERFEVTGVDFSLAQLRLAQKLAQGAKLACQDLTAMGLAPESFDAICSFYAIIHVPRDLHFDLLADFHKLLVPGGLALLCLGAEDLEEDIENDYFGAQMYWSHYDEFANRKMLRDVGFQVEWSALVPDAAFGEGRHLFVLANKSYA